MQSNRIDQEELTKYFENIVKNPIILNPKQMVNFKEETYGSPEEEICNNIKLPAKFKPCDFAYHQFDDFYLISICGENAVIFVYFEPASKKMQIFPSKNTIVFSDPKIVENLKVIKAGYIYGGPDGSKREEVFATAGKLGPLYIFKVLKLKETFRMIKLEGHFNDINDLAFAPCELRPELRNLLVTCSNDGSMMIWNIFLGAVVICLKPNKLPLDDILSVDWEYPGDRIVSAHLDAIRVWPLTEDMLSVIKSSHNITKKDKAPERIDSRNVEAKIKNFHDYYIDNIKMLPNNCIITKSVEGAIHVWTYQQAGQKEWNVIPFNNYKTLSSITGTEKKHSYFKISVNPFDQLIVAPDRKGKIRVFMPRYAESLAFKIFKLKAADTETGNPDDIIILKGTILEPDLKYILAITEDGKLWYHEIADLDLS